MKEVSVALSQTQKIESIRVYFEGECEIKIAYEDGSTAEHKFKEGNTSSNGSGADDKVSGDTVEITEVSGDNIDKKSEEAVDKVEVPTSIEGQSGEEIVDPNGETTNIPYNIPYEEWTKEQALQFITDAASVTMPELVQLYGLDDNKTVAEINAYLEEKFLSNKSEE